MQLQHVWRLPVTQRAVVALVISAASLFGCAKTLARDTAGSKSTPIVTFDGFGPAKVGMTVVEAEAALKVNFILEEIPDIGEAAQICSYYMSPTFPGVHLMVLKGRIARIDV